MQWRTIPLVSQENKSDRCVIEIYFPQCENHNQCDTLLLRHYLRKFSSTATNREQKKKKKNSHTQTYLNETESWRDTYHRKANVGKIGDEKQKKWKEQYVKNLMTNRTSVTDNAEPNISKNFILDGSVKRPFHRTTT